MTFIYLIAYFNPNPSCILCLCCLTSFLSLQCFCIVHCLLFSVVQLMSDIVLYHFFLHILIILYSHSISFLNSIKLFLHVCLIWFQLLLTKLIMVISFKTNANYLDFAVESGVTHNNMSPKIYAFYTVCLRELPLTSE
jgi:hypothetical protein